MTAICHHIAGVWSAGVVTKLWAHLGGSTGLLCALGLILLLEARLILLCSYPSRVMWAVSSLHNSHSHLQNSCDCPQSSSTCWHFLLERGSMGRVIRHPHEIPATSFCVSAVCTFAPAVYGFWGARVNGSRVFLCLCGCGGSCLWCGGAFQWCKG